MLIIVLTWTSKPERGNYQIADGQLIDLLDEKISHPINPGNKKIIIFTAFTDTANYLYKTFRIISKSNTGFTPH